jgi:TusA-related sulfurtransferase
MHSVRGGFALVTLVQVPRYIALLKNYASKPTLTKWCKNDGEMVDEGQALLLVETSKASLEIEAIASGILFILRNAGEKVKIGDTLGVIAKNKASFNEFRDRLLQYPMKK